MSGPAWQEATAAQHGMWITARQAGDHRALHMPLTIRLRGPLDVAALTRACEVVVERHPVLGSAMAERDGVFGLVPAAEPPRLSVLDPWPGEEAVRKELERPFEPGEPLARFALGRPEPDHHLLFAVVHHAVFDGMSKDILVRELALAYGGGTLPPVTRGTPEPAPQDAAEFWRPRWQDGGTVALPGLREVSLRAETGDYVDVDLGSGCARLADAAGVTRFEALLSAFHIVLAAYTGPGAATVTTSVDLSTRTPEDTAIDLFVNELPVASTVDPANPFAAHARKLRAELREIYRYRRVPLSRVVGGMRPRAALTPVSVSYRKREADPAFPGLAAEVEWMAFNGGVRGTLHLQAVEGPDGIAARLQFNPACLDRAACEQVAADLRRLLDAAAEGPFKLIRALPRPERGVSLPVLPAAPASAGTPETEAPAEVPDKVYEEVAAIWRKVLGIDDIHPDDDLFDLGGHSLTITQIIAQVHQRLGVELDLDTFFETPTLAGLVQEVRTALG